MREGIRFSPGCLEEIQKALALTRGSRRIHIMGSITMGVPAEHRTAAGLLITPARRTREAVTLAEDIPAVATDVAGAIEPG